MAASYSDELTNLAQRLNPQSLLAIGPGMKARFRDFAAGHPDCRLDFLGAADVLNGLQGRGIYDLVVLSGVIESMDKARAGTLLGCLRDQHARELALVVPIGSDWPEQESHWERNDLLAFGMSLQGSYEEQGRPVHLYRFSLRDYKATPEWLNPKYWAHPELFGKFRW